MLYKELKLMRRSLLPILLATVGLSTAAFAAPDAANVGIVNFSTCISDSKLGKQEQASFESLKKQMTTMLEDTEKQLNEISAKFNDADFLDGLSPEAEEELKVKFRTLNEELSRYQNQYYQVLNQANMRIIQTLSTSINGAAEKVAKNKNLTMVLNKDACFFYSPALEITPLIVAEMDRNFDQDGKKQAAAPAPAEASAVEKSEVKAK